MAMPLPDDTDQLSDDEIFFGKLSLKEVKKHILWNEMHNLKKRNNDRSYIKIIETHSEPDLNKNNSKSLDKKAISTTSLSPDTQPYAKWNVNPADDSFLKVEKMITDLCVPHQSEKVVQINNTLDIIDYILSNGPPQSSPEKNNRQYGVQREDTVKIENEPLSTLVQEDQKPNIKSSACFTPVPKNTQKEAIDSYSITPTTDIKQKELFKTPKIHISQKKPSGTTLKKTPSRSNAYQHIASPVASYIKNCPVAPLLKEVRPMKPLPSTSSIPKYVKIPHSTKSNSKENINLPQVAYKSAKKTKVIDVPDADKLPQTQWMKRVTSSLPKPVILKHNHREINLAKRILGTRQEDSFADLSLRQADVSVCTKKSAFNKPKIPL